VSTARAARRLAPLLVGVCLWLPSAGCSRERTLGAAAREEAPANAGRTRRTSEYELTGGSAELAFGPPTRPVRGHLPLAQGRLWLDMAELGATRAVFTFDLAGLVVEGTPAESRLLAPGRSLTEQSLDWLQLSDPRRLAAAPERRFARFELSSFVADGGAAAPGEPAAAPGTRRVRGRATGELELQGYRLPYTVVVAATASWPEGARSTDPPARVELAIVEPVAIDPLRHEIVPRDVGGEVRSGALSELRKLPSNNTVRVSGRWVAEGVERSSHR